MEEKMLEEVFKKAGQTQFFASIEVFRAIAKTQG